MRCVPSLMPVAHQRVDNPEGWRGEKELSHAIGTLSSHGLSGADEYNNCGSTLAQVAASAHRNSANTEPVCVTLYPGASLDAPSNWTSDGWFAFSARPMVSPAAGAELEIVSSEMRFPSSSKNRY